MRHKNLTLEEAVEDRRMRDTFGGYDWGDPIRLWTFTPEPEFTREQFAIADRAAA